MTNMSVCWLSWRILILTSSSLRPSGYGRQAVLPTHSMQIDPHIFRAYDIRGKAHEQLSAEASELIGRGFGSVLVEKYGDHPKVVVGRDARTHSLEFQEAVMKGLMNTGCTVFNIGQTPSPVNYFSICNGGFDAGVQVTASHNPAEDNGLKLQLRNAEAYAGESLQTLRKRIEAEDFLNGEGGSLETYDGIGPYAERLTEMFKELGSGLGIGVDAGNGVAGPLYAKILEQISCSVYGLYLEPDGTFPNHAADPSKYDTLKELQELVKKEQLQMGFAYDGDGDRVGLVDEQGNIRTADEILLLLAKDHLSRNKDMPVVFTVSNSGALETEIAKWGGKPVMCKVGHSFVEHAMTEHNALLGGEQSGHFFCGEDYYGFDDALMTTLRLIKIIVQSGKTVSEMCSEFPPVYQSPERRPHCEDSAKADVIAKITEYFQKDYPVETMDGARIDFGEGAWAGIRMSNTSPKISICIEARNPENLKEVENTVLEHIKSYPEVDLASQD